MHQQCIRLVVLIPPRGQRPFQIAGLDITGKAIDRVIGNFDGLRLILLRHDGKDRPEHLFDGNCVRAFDIGKHRRPHIKALVEM